MMGSNPTNLMVNPQVATQIQHVQQSDDKSTNLASVSSTTQSPVVNRIQQVCLCLIKKVY